MVLTVHLGILKNFTDEDDEWTDHESFEDFGYDSNEISEKLYNMRLEFTKKVPQ